MLVLAVQPLALAIIFAYAGLGKLASPAWLAAARESSFARLTGPRFALAYRTVGAAEVVLAGLLLMPPAATWELLVASGALLMFMVYLIASHLTWGVQSCGCMGSTATPGLRAPLLRLAVMSSMVALGLGASHYWFDAVRDSPPLVLLALAECALVLAVSREAWSALPRRAGSNQHPKCATARVPVEDSLAALTSSVAFRRMRGVLTAATPADDWRDGCWRFFAFAADNHSPGALAVFAVPILKSRVRVRAAIVAAEGEQVAGIRLTGDTAG